MIHIYTLCDPRTGDIRYVGQTRQYPGVRLSQHVAGSKRGRRHIDHWIAKLLREGARPQLVVIETVETREDADAREIFWIAHHRTLGCDLCNATDGGYGGAPRNPSAETRARLGAKSKANWDDPVYRAFHVARVQNVGDQTRQLISAQSRALWDDPEWAAAQRARLQDPIYRAKRSQIAREISARRRLCDDCEKTGTPTNMSRHLKWAGHSGSTLIVQATS